MRAWLLEQYYNKRVYVGFYLWLALGLFFGLLFAGWMGEHYMVLIFLMMWFTLLYFGVKVWDRWVDYRFERKRA